MMSDAGAETDMGKIFKQLQNPTNTVDDTFRALVDAGSFAWFSYGIMAMTNLIYYVDKFYWNFMIRDDQSILAFRTWWGMSEFVRVVGNYGFWGLTLLFWGMTFIPLGFFMDIFVFWTTILLWASMIRMGSILIMKCMAFILDSYTDEYMYYPYKIEWGGESSLEAIDFSLELSSFTGQLVAYPLMQHSATQLRRHKDGKVKRK